MCLLPKSKTEPLGETKPEGSLAYQWRTLRSVRLPSALDRGKGHNLTLAGSGTNPCPPGVLAAIVGGTMHASSGGLGRLFAGVFLLWEAEGTGRVGKPLPVPYSGSGGYVPTRSRTLQ